jgi:hypothetical protein
MNLMLNMKDINKILAKIESYVWEKIVISDPLLYRRPLLLRQLKNNQNQTIFNIKFMFCICFIIIIDLIFIDFRFIHSYLDICQ